MTRIYIFMLAIACAAAFSPSAQSATIIFPYEEAARAKNVQIAPHDSVAIPTAPAISAPTINTPAAPSVLENQIPSKSAPGAVVSDRYASQCIPTPALGRVSYPGKNNIPTSNMLARPGGKSIFADGVRLYLTGRIFDGACVPMREAHVEIWQADANGTYRYAQAGTLSNPYQTFAGAGQVETDNRGEYVFETVVPGAALRQAPFINLRITHPALRAPLITTLYFEGQSGNSEDSAYIRLPESVKSLVTRPLIPFKLPNGTQGMRVHHDITVRARDGFRSF